MRPLALLIMLAGFASAAEPPGMKVRITGMFAPEREAEFRGLLKDYPGVTLASFDFDRAEGVLAFDAATLFPKQKPEQIVAKLDEQVRKLSTGTFGVKAASTVARDKLERVEIGVSVLDCKACCLAAYEIVAKVEGVEQATASSKEGKITALIDPTKTDREKLVAALKARTVAVK